MPHQGSSSRRPPGTRTRRISLTAATGLGVLFLAGQALAWQQLRDAGLFIASSPSAAFFYVLTATHAAHVVGAVAALTRSISAFYISLAAGFTGFFFFVKGMLT